MSPEQQQGWLDRLSPESVTPAGKKTIDGKERGTASFAGEQGGRRNTGAGTAGSDRKAGRRLGLFQIRICVCEGMLDEVTGLNPDPSCGTLRKMH